MDAILQAYKNITINYEESRQISERIIQEYKRQTITEIDQCSQIVAYANCSRVVKWLLISLDGTVLYESGNYLDLSTCILHLEQLKIEPYTRFKVKANSGGPDDMSEQILEYVPNSNTAYYNFTNVYFPNTPELYYSGIVKSSSSPPVYKCSGIEASNSSPTLVKWSLISKGQTIYTSGRYPKWEMFMLDFNKLDIPPGTKLTFKSNVIAGSDSTAYIILEYDPNDIHFARFELEGTTSKTLTLYASYRYRP